MAGELDDERAVLGDDLQQRGDPQGELIGLQLALEALPATAPPARRNVIERKVAALLDQHHETFYGALAPHVARLSRPDPRDLALVVKTWRGGFADTIWLQRTRTTELADVVLAMRALPIMRFARRLELDAGDHVAAVAALDPLPSLRELSLEFATDPLRLSVRLTNTEALAPFIAQLEVLQIEYAVRLAPLDAPRLRKLNIYIERDGGPSTRLLDDPLPELEDLTAYSIVVDPSFMARYPKLRRLSLNTELPPGWFETALRSGDFARLDVLAIGSLGDADLAVIIEHQDRLGAMRKLDLSRNYFSPEARAAVADRLPRCLRYR